MLRVNVRDFLRWTIAAFYFAAGVLHLRSTADFALIVPDWVPDKLLVVQLTGLCELAGALGLTIPATRAWAGAALALYALCVFPANIKHAVDHIDVPGLPNSLWYHVPRLLLQPVLIWLTLFCVDLAPPRREVLPRRADVVE